MFAFFSGRVSLLLLLKQVISIHIHILCSTCAFYQYNTVFSKFLYSNNTDTYESYLRSSAEYGMPATLIKVQQSKENGN